MGQYYNVMVGSKTGKRCKVYDRKVKGSDVWHGAKLMEHSWLDNEFVGAVCNELYNKAQRVAWVGDYANDVLDDVASEFANTHKKVTFLKYENAWGENAKYRMIDPQDELFTVRDKFLVNHDKKQYLNINKYIKNSTYSPKWDNSAKWCAHFLPLLTAVGNGMGGGDYGGSDENLVGIWTWDLLQIVDADELPSKYTEADVTFIEG